MGTRIEAGLTALRLPPARLLAELDIAWARGDAVLPVPQALAEEELRGWLRAFRPARVIDDRGTEELAGAQPVRAGTALVVATSGTSGPLKGVVLSHAALRGSLDASLERLGAAPGDRWLACLPLHHVAGLLAVLRSRALGTEPVLHGRFEPGLVAAAPARLFVSLVPTMLWRLLEQGVDVSRFARILLGGAAAPQDLLARARDAGAHVVTSYGMTETCGGCVYDGVPLRGVAARLGADRRIELRGPVLFDGYRGGARHRGWLVTSDVGTWERDGRLRVLGRADAVIVTGGENVPADQVAGLLTDHPSIAEAAVVGAPDAEWGAKVVAYITLAPGARAPSLPELRDFVASRAPRHHAPRQLHVVRRLPRTRLGTIDARALST